MTTPLPAGLSAVHDHVRDELRRADTKATTLLSLVGAAMAGVIALSTRPASDPATVLLWLALAPILASIVLLLLVIRPRLNHNPVPGSWLHAAQVGASTLLESVKYGLATSAAHEVCGLARVARRKYRRIAVAIVLLLAGLALVATSLLITAVTS